MKSCNESLQKVKFSNLTKELGGPIAKKRPFLTIFAIFEIISVFVLLFSFVENNELEISRL